MKKTLTVSLILFIALSMFLTGCRRAGPLQPTPGTDASPVIAKVGDYDLTLGEFNYFLYSNFSSAEQMGQAQLDLEQDLDGVTMGQTLMEETVKAVKSFRAIEMMAVDLKLDLDAARASVETELTQYNQQFGSAEAFNAELNKYGYNIEVYRYVRYIQTLGNQVYEYYYAANGAEAPDPSLYTVEMVTATHILIRTVDDNDVSLSDDEKAMKHSIAVEALERARAGEDFYALVDEYGEDPGVMKTDEEGNTVNEKQNYTFTHEEMVPEFSDAAFTLPENGISDIVETTYGYHIVKRLPLDTAASEERVASEREAYCGSLFQQKLDTISETIPFTPNDTYNTLSVAELYSEYTSLLDTLMAGQQQATDPSDVVPSSQP